MLVDTSENVAKRDLTGVVQRFRFFIFALIQRSRCWVAQQECVVAGDMLIVGFGETRLFVCDVCRRANERLHLCNT